MNTRRLVISMTTLTILLLLTPTSNSHYEEVDQLIGHIDRNFNIINSEIARRGQHLSPVFLDNVNANKEIFEELKKDKEKFDNKVSNTADRQNYVAELKAVDIDTSGAASFLQTAPSDDDGETKVVFETLYKDKLNNGWWVCWIGYARSKRPNAYPFCYTDTSTPLPKEGSQPLASGCKYVISIMDPKTGIRLYPFEKQNPYIEIPRADTVHPIRILVPYKIKK